MRAFRKILSGRVGVIMIRKEVLWFAHQMENKLKENDYKGGWDRCTREALLYRLDQELQELKNAIGKIGKRHLKEDVVFELVIRESADVANFAMMIADNCQKRAELLAGEK